MRYAWKTAITLKVLNNSVHIKINKMAHSIKYTETKFSHGPSHEKVITNGVNEWGCKLHSYTARCPIKCRKPVLKVIIIISVEQEVSTNNWSSTWHFCGVAPLLEWLDKQFLFRENVFIALLTRQQQVVLCFKNIVQVGLKKQQQRTRLKWKLFFSYHFAIL